MTVQLPLSLLIFVGSLVKDLVRKDYTTLENCPLLHLFRGFYFTILFYLFLFLSFPNLLQGEELRMSLSCSIVSFSAPQSTVKRK
ncbi:hypothetical protein BDV27DRAFT_134706 [Aspergillus caelatus]|uniref:Uncharacterized protein n=1 Tax=Aspergillus caelatus TaxID=61420 RepID=A0A5N6ZRY3_9EURO|nr:uncharacterized protein BDV27DRAFT_134706 [Aspergillus caelatus]KAE8360334.1 hypothetical protein BDV27DRAFT_134706 [Aspergillus caelatus]